MEDKPQSPYAGVILVIVFAAAIAVFAGVAIVCKHLLSQYVEHEDLRTVLSFAVAAAVTLVFLHTVKMINRRMTKDT
jgi:NADH:ubiquinone oxidoreductase subunit 6 (subunit J)